MRVLPQAAARVGDADAVEQLLGLLPGGVAAQAPVAFEHFGDLDADLDHGVEAGERVLEDHRQVRAAAAAHVRAREREQVDAVEPGLAGDVDAATATLASRNLALAGQEPHDRQARHGLAAARLADQAHHLALVDVEVHAVDGRGVAERDPQVLYFEQCH